MDTTTRVVPEAPGKPVVSGISSTVLTLKWTAPRNSFCTGFRVDSQANGGEWSVRVRNTNNSKTSRAVMNLDPETTYRFKVYAISPVGLGPPSLSSDTVTTRPGMAMPSFKKASALARPQTAPVRRPQISGDGGRDEKLIRRRYFFRGEDPAGGACDGNTVFNYHYDVVTLDLSARQAGRQHRAPWAPVAKVDPDIDVETLYFQDHQLHGNPYALQNNLHTITPQGKFDLPKLLSWATSIRPRHQQDALPMFVLLQNLVRSLLEDKIAASRMAADKEELLRLRASESELRSQLLVLESSMQAAADHKIAAAERKVEAAEEETARLRVEIADVNARWKQKMATAEEGAQVLRSQLQASEGARAGLERSLGEATEQAARDAAKAQQAMDALAVQLEEQRAQAEQLNKKLAESVLKAAASPGGGAAGSSEGGLQAAQEKAGAALEAAREGVLKMRSQIAELKGYSVEPKHSQVVRGVLELLGSKQSEVEGWEDCRKLLGADVCDKIGGFDPKAPKLGTKAKSVRAAIGGLVREEVHKGSEAVGALFGWLQAAISAQEAAAACAAEEAAAAAAAAEAAAAEAEAAPAEAAAAEAEAAPAEAAAAEAEAAPAEAAAAEAEAAPAEAAAAEAEAAPAEAAAAEAEAAPAEAAAAEEAAAEAEAAAAEAAPAEAEKEVPAAAAAPAAVSGATAAAAGKEVHESVLAGSVYQSALRCKPAWPSSPLPAEVLPMAPPELRALFVEVLSSQVRDQLRGKLHTSFGEAAQNQLLHQHGARAPALAALHTVARALQEPSPEPHTALLRALVGSCDQSTLFSTQASALLCRFVALFKKVPEDTAQVSEALSSLADPSCSCELVAVLAALQQAVEVEGFLTIRADRLQQEAKVALGAIEGSCSLDKALQFVLSVHQLEEAESTARLSTAFMGTGLEAPALGSLKHIRQISLKEWTALLQTVCAEAGHPLEHAEQLLGSLYWRSAMQGGGAELSVGSFVEALKEAGLHRRRRV